MLGAGVVTAVLSTDARRGLITEGAGSLPSGDLGIFLNILGRNVSAALGLFTGVITFGIGTVVMLLLIGTMLGLSMAISVDLLGVAETIARSWAYTPLEISGFIVAGAAGLIPVTGQLRNAPDVPRPPYHQRFSRALRWFGIALALITLGAVVETMAIAAHHMGSP